MSPDLADVLAGIHAAVHELADPGGLVDQLRDVMASRTQAASEAATARRPPGTRPPWESQAANAYLTIHAWARDAEAELGTYVRGHYIRRVGGSDRTTRDCLEFVAVFCDDSRVPESDVRRIARTLGVLLRTAQRVPAIDTAPPAAASLRQTCPVCTTPLEVNMEALTIDCPNEACASSWSRAQWPALLARLGSS